MIEKQTLSDPYIIDCLNTHYTINVITLDLLPLGADIDASVYKAQAYDKSAYFVKLKRGYHHDSSTTIQLLLHNAGIQHIIAPLKTKAGQPTHHIEDFTLIVYPFIEGQDGFSRDLTKDQWITLGKTLRQVHGIHLPPSIKDQIKQESYSPKWRDAVRSIYTHIATQPPIADEVASKLLTFMNEHQQIIKSLIDLAEQLGKKLRRQSHELVLCHSDIHGGNVLLANNGALYIVDWDQPIMAPKERDLMFIGGGVANIWNKPYEEEFFYSGYGKTEIDREIITYYRCERIVEDIAVYSQQLLLTAEGGKDREVMYQHFVNMFEPRGVVEIALTTDTTLY